MTDTLSPEQRAERMSKVRSSGNKSTEGRAIKALEEEGIAGWITHPSDVPGTPDIYFPGPPALAVFLDGCFWHGCKCKRLPKTRTEFWRKKIETNRRRDRRVRRACNRAGIGTIRFWEHDLKHDGWLARLKRRLQKEGLLQEG